MERALTVLQRLAKRGIVVKSGTFPGSMRNYSDTWPQTSPRHLATNFAPLFTAGRTILMGTMYKLGSNRSSLIFP